MLGAIVLMLQAVTAGAGDAPIVVTGRSLGETSRALQACLARKCPPKEDIDASLAHAEAEFVAGKYTESFATLRKSIKRNGQYKARYPVDVSDLWRATSRVAIHIGEADYYRIGAIESLDALKAGLPGTDFRVLAQKLEVADTFARLGRVDAALTMYRDIGREADRAGQTMIRGHAMFRSAMLYGVIAETQPAYAERARKAIAVLTADPDPKLKPFADAAQLLRISFDARKGDAGAIDALIANAGQTERPALLFAPPIKQIELNKEARDGQLSMAAVEEQWVDIGFWVTPDGRVNDAGILREAEHLERGWTKPVITAIAARRYAPLKMAAGSPGVFRIERYTQTALLEVPTGSHLKQRNPYPRIEMLDLTDDKPSPKVVSSGG